MTQARRASRRTKVLEVGTGSGYQAAVLSRICRRVYTIERFKELLQTAEARFLQLRLHNITTRHGDGWRSEEHTSELQSLMRISYAVFCLKKKKQYNSIKKIHNC